MIPLALALIVLAVLLLFIAARQRKSAGMPTGRVVYSDTRAWGKVEKPFYDARLGLTGRPDYLVEHNGAPVPVEVKSSGAPPAPYESHIFQLAAYCLLVELSGAARPPYGLVRYRNRTFAVDYTPTLEQRLLDLLEEMRLQEKQPANRSHDDPARCARCGYRSVCDQRL